MGRLRLDKLNLMSLKYGRHPIIVVAMIFLIAVCGCVGDNGDANNDDGSGKWYDGGDGSASGNSSVVAYFFWGDGCPHCAEMEPFLAELEDKYPGFSVKSFEVWYDEDNQDFFEQMSKAYGKEVSGVPTVFIGEKVWIGYSTAISWDIEQYVADCVDEGCIDPISKVSGIGNEADVLQSHDTTSPVNPICVHVFIDPTCEPCRNIGPYLDSLSDTYNINLERHDVTDASEMELFSEFKAKYGIINAGYPILFIGDKYLIGQDMINSHLADEIEYCLDEGCVCPDEYIKGTLPYIPTAGEYVPSDEDVVELPIVGEVHLTSMPLMLSTAIIALVDGFNPCSLWVLTFLMGIVVYSGSRKKTFLVGITFLGVTAAVYGLFMLGIINVLRYTMYLSSIRVVVAIFALFFGVVNVKDFFWYKRGLSLTISDKRKPKIFRDMRSIMRSDLPLRQMLFGTAVMALGITLIELPCTAGFPVIWSNLVAGADISGAYFALLFAIYMFIYLIDELAVFSVAVISLQASRFEEKHGRILKLIGGMIMVALSLVLVYAPEVMNSLGGTMKVFGSAILLSLAIVFVYGRKVGFDRVDEPGNEDDGSGKKTDGNGPVGGKKAKKPSRE